MFYLGLTLFFGIHLVPLNTSIKNSLKLKLGETIYICLFSLISLVGLSFIVFGYESNSTLLYPISGLLIDYSEYVMFLSLTLLVASIFPTYIKQFIKHPMSMGIAIWAVLHLLTNSDKYSIILFSSFLIYAFISVVVAELRAKKTKLTDTRFGFDILAVILGIFLTFLAFNYHEYLSGVRLV